MKVTAIIVDDELKLRDVLALKLNEHCPEVDIVEKVANAKEAYRCIIENDPDLVFLDISMPGESGFQLLERFDTINFEIIFVTGYNEYGLDALKVSAVDYLLKPVRTEDLKDAVNKAVLRIQDKDKIAHYDLLKHNLNSFGDQNSKIAIPGSNAYDFVELQEIINCEGWQKYTKVHLTNGTTIVSSYNIGVFKDMLIPYGFFSTHKSYLINKKHIQKYVRDGDLVMSNGNEVPVARRRREEFLKTINKVG